MRTFAIIILTCLCLCHSYHMREEQRLSAELQSIRDLLNAQTETQTIPKSPIGEVAISVQYPQCIITCDNRTPFPIHFSGSVVGD